MYYLFLLALGLSVGSFLGALTFRYPRNKSVLYGRSYCPKCGKIIAWYDNIPLLSFLILGGKCRNCNKPISWRYPLIEVSTAVTFVLIGYRFQSFWLVAFYILVSSILVSIFVIDIEHKIIPDDFVFFGLLVFVVYSLFIIPDSLFPRLFAGFLSALFLLLIHLTTRGRGMGLGDVKFAILGGTVLGLPIALVWLFLAFLTGGVLGVILILLGKAKLKQKIAFGPFLALSLGLSLLWGEKILTLLLP